MIRGYLQQPIHNQELQALLGQERKDLWLRRWRHPHQCYWPDLHVSLGPYSQERWNFALAERLRTGSHEAYAPFMKLPFMKCCSSLDKNHNLKEGFCESVPERNPCKMTASSPREPFRPGFVQDSEREDLSSIQGAFHERDIQAAWATQWANVVANTQYPAVVWTLW